MAADEALREKVLDRINKKIANKKLSLDARIADLMSQFESQLKKSTKKNTLNINISDFRESQNLDNNNSAKINPERKYIRLIKERIPNHWNSKQTNNPVF